MKLRVQNPTRYVKTDEGVGKADRCSELIHDSIPPRRERSFGEI